MSENNHEELFKTTLMGGFDKDDVMTKVQNLKDQAYAAQKKLEAKIEENEQEIEKLNRKIREREDKIEDLSANAGTGQPAERRNCRHPAAGCSGTVFG